VKTKTNVEFQKPLRSRYRIALAAWSDPLRRLGDAPGGRVSDNVEVWPTIRPNSKYNEYMFSSAVATA